MKRPVNTQKLVDRMNEELVGMKGRRKAKAVAEAIIKEETGQEYPFQAYRDNYHHYHIVQHENGGGDSIFVSFSGNKVKQVTKY